MNYFKIFLGIFVALAASRFIPHPPNFTSLIALSFYIPALMGIRYLPALIMSFVITDFVIGFHGTTLFTWGSVVVIGLGSKYFISSIFTRISGALLGACLFFIITNFGVWITGSMYPKNIFGLILCYTLAIPFYKGTQLGFLFYSFLLFGIMEFLKVKIISKS